MLPPRSITPCRKRCINARIQYENTYGDDARNRKGQSRFRPRLALDLSVRACLPIRKVGMLLFSALCPISAAWAATTTKTRRGDLPAASGELPRQSIGDGRPCDGCFETIEPTELLFGVIVQNREIPVP